MKKRLEPKRRKRKSCENEFAESAEDGIGDKIELLNVKLVRYGLSEIVEVEIE